MSAVAIRADNVVRDFGAVRALDHLSLEVPAGIVFGFLGPNGAGKTTAIRTFLGLVQPTEGRATPAARRAARPAATATAESDTQTGRPSLTRRQGPS